MFSVRTRIIVYRTWKYGICQHVCHNLLSFIDSCPANFTGATCETNVDECLVLSNPCKNGATCTDVFGGYLCRCISGWEGFDCSKNKNDCIADANGSPPCLHGGTCVDRVGKYDCICQPGWTGNKI